MIVRCATLLVALAFPLMMPLRAWCGDAPGLPSERLGAILRALRNPRCSVS